MRAARLLAACFSFLALTASAAAHSTAAPATPQNLHAFLLRADEPVSHEFSRTPAFAWDPVKGAAHYEFVLSTSPLFSTSGIVWDDQSPTSPAAAVPIALPWITGNPYSLYARVRAIGQDGSIGQWSAPFGFNMRWPDVPQQLSAPAGLLRWTPVDGATAYEIWLLNADIGGGHDKIIRTTTNVADEREFYAFHQTQQFMGTVEWRVRAVREVYGALANGLPAVSRGPWSPEYTSTNPAFVGGPLTPVGTISDVASAPGQPTAHALMPAFVFTGDQNLDGTVSPLYRIYVSTDQDCLNIVFKGAIVGSPAYAPRSSGPLALPGDATSEGLAASHYLPDGAEGSTIMLDGDPVQTTESLAPPTFTPPASADSSATGSSGTPSGSSSSSSDSSSSGSSSSSSSSAPTQQLSITGPGAPIDLWDTNWPTGRYYWTVVGVDPRVPPATSTALVAAASTGATTIQLASATGFAAGASVQIGPVGLSETTSILSISGNTATLTSPLKNAYAPGSPVATIAGGITYVDHDLVQDVCAAGRVFSFGKQSPPAVTQSSAPYASGLSPTGRLVAATHVRPAFYGTPLVAWAPAPGASAYEVQWSKTSYPWKPAAAPLFTFSTEANLALAPGTWYYRVRGIDVSLPTGAQQMSWSDPTELVVAKPKFKLVGGASAPKSSGKSKGKSTTSGSKRWRGTGFAITLPKAWEKTAPVDTSIAFQAYDPTLKAGYRTSVAVIPGAGRGTQTLDQWEQALVAKIVPMTTAPIVHKQVTEPGGPAVYIAFDVTDNGKPAVSVNYIFDAGTKSYDVEFLTLQSLQTKYASVFAAAARSFRVG